MLVDLYEVYSDGSGAHFCLGFKSKEQAKTQTILQPCSGPYKATVSVSEEELNELNSRGYIWL